MVIEVKRIGEIAGVEQLLRYQERLDLDANARTDEWAVRRHAHQAPGPVFAESRGVQCIEIDIERLRADAPPDLRLF